MDEHVRRSVPPGRRCLAVLLVLLAALLPAGCGGGDGGGAPVVNLYNAPQQNLVRNVERCNTPAEGAYRIVLNTLSRGADDQREQLVRRLAAEDPGLDVLGLDVLGLEVLGLDVTWTAELAEAAWIREWTGEYARRAVEDTLEQPLGTAKWRGKLYAAPYNTNVQLLWYRSDLIPEPPSTWSGLMETSARLAAAGKPHYGEVTGAQYEGIVVWFNSLVASAGGRILSPGGERVDLGPPALQALQTVRDFARSPAADPSLSNTREDDARLAVEAGRAAYEVNWPYVYASMAANRPDLVRYFRWAPYPGITADGRSPLGGANFAVSRYSRHPLGPAASDRTSRASGQASRMSDQLVARLDAKSPAREGEILELTYDPAQLHLFHPQTGTNLIDPT